MTYLIAFLGLIIAVAAFVFGFGAVGAGAEQGRVMGKRMVRVGFYLLIVSLCLVGLISACIGFSFGQIQ